MTEPSVVLLERLTRILHNLSGAEGLKPAQWEALRYLARANRFSRSPGALTAYLGVTKGTVSQTLQALERKGLIEKSTAEGDRRGIRLALTSTGSDLVKNDPAGEIEAVIKTLPTEQRTDLQGLLEIILRRMIDRRGGRAFGACKTCRHFAASHAHGDPHFCRLLNQPLSRTDREKICAEQELAA